MNKIIAQLKSIAFVILFFVGCATYQHHVHQARQEISNGNFTKAITQLEVLAKTPGDDQLVYLLDYALALQLSGRYKESNEAFHLADKLSEVKDYHSISRVAGSLALNEGMVQYKGEDYEKILINGFSAINYVLLNQYEEALVEIRKLNEKLYKYQNEAKLDYKPIAFAHYLAALIWEQNKAWDDCYIEFDKTYQINKNISVLKNDLLHSAYKARRTDELKKWQQEFGMKIDNKEVSKDVGQLVFLYQQGWSPRKFPRPENFHLPMLRPHNSYTRKARLSINGVGTYDTEVVSNVSEIAIEVFNAAYAALVGKRIVGLVVKDQIAQKLDEHNKGLGGLAYLAMTIADQADLRQWSTLPETIQIAKVTLPKGQYTIDIQGLNGTGHLTGENGPTQTIAIIPGKKTFINWRSFK